MGLLAFIHAFVFLYVFCSRVGVHLAAHNHALKVFILLKSYLI